MGTGGSLPNNFKSQEPPPLPPPFDIGNLQSGVSRISGSSCESQRDRRTSRTSTVTLGNPGFQYSRYSGSIKNEESWHQRPSAPSLSSLRPQQETLLTYAAQMTGWQSGCESAVPSTNQEVMELSRTVSHLAAANQQLATAHTTFLSHLEFLYLELNRERELRFEWERGEKTPGGRSTESDCEDERDKLDDRTVNLRATMSKRLCQLRENIMREEAARTSSMKDIAVQSENLEIPLELCSGLSRLEMKTSKRSERRENFDTNCNNERDSVESDLSIEYRKAVDRIQSLENELAQSHVNIDSSRYGEEYESNERRAKNESKNLSNEQETRKLLEEIERLRNERLEYREKNEKLANDLDNQVILMEKLRRDYEISRSQCKEIESSLNEGKRQFEELMLRYENAEFEKSRLSKELRSSDLERNTANARIVDLEKELLDSTLANERIAKIENQESSRLRKVLSEAMVSERAQVRALVSALEEIQRLNQVIENGCKDEPAQEVPKIPEIESTQEEEVLDTEVSVPGSSNMDEFRKELGLKREARQRAIAAVSSEMDRLRRELDAEKEAHSETSRVLDLLKSGQATNTVTKSEIVGNDPMTPKNVDVEDKNDWQTVMQPDAEVSTNEADARALTDILKVSDELRSSIRLQTEKIDDLRYHLECEPEGHKNRIANLKEIATKSREVSANRERQINKLKNLLAQILARLGDPRFRVEISDDVRAEHDRQLEDIRRLKSLYDDRLRVLVDLKDAASKELIDVKEKLKGSRKENSGLEEDLKKAEEKIDNQDTEISNLDSQLGLTKADCRDLQNQMSVINGLFTQMLLSASSADMDLDRLTRLLQENHDLISDMAREEGSEAAALPKLLLDLVEQVEGRGSGKSGDGESDKKEEGQQEENIAHNLPKVWRVLLELLSCHAVDSPPVTPASLSTDPNSCYKSVDTPSGPRLVISVSKTYIRLKELILEKKHLEKEMNRMKQLNTHLESKLGEQEKRLSTVSSELSKTWNVVGRMQAQHQQLHTHEKILRYELQQKRKMLQELKQELEYCREKWESARQKNTNTEIEWRSLRREFAARKSLAAQDSFNNSGESGFSDERGDDSDEEDEAVEERVRIGPRRRARKENPRAPTPDTESEQPTDTELSETKTGSTATPEQRTPTPEACETIEDASVASTSGIEKATNDEHALPYENMSLMAEEDREADTQLNPLDQGLVNVIQNLITIGKNDSNPSGMLVKESESENITDFPSSSAELEVVGKSDIEENHSDDQSTINVDHEIQVYNHGCKDVSNEDETPPSIMSVFSIGPFPTSSMLPSAKSVQFSDPLIVGPSTQVPLPALADCVQGPQDTSLVTKVTEVEDITNGTGTEINTEATKDETTSIPSTSSNLEECSSRSHDDLSEVSGCTSKEIATPSTSMVESSVQSPSKPVRSHEEVLAARSARLKRLEEQADWLMKKMNATSKRGSALNTRLEELHEAYGEAPVPPPMPDVLPNVRIPSEMRSRQEKKSSDESPNETPPPDSP